MEARFIKLKIISIIVLFICLLGSFTSCGLNGNKKSNITSVTNSTQNASTNSNDSKINETGANQNNETKKSGDFIFSLGSYSEIPELQGNVVNEKKQNASKSEFLNIVKNPIAFSSWNLICSTPRIILQYPIPNIADLEDMENYYNGINQIEIKYYDLPQMLSNNLGLTVVQDNVGKSYITRGILVDYDKNVLIAYRNEKNVQTIIKAIKFKDEFSVKNLKVISGYIQDGTLKTVLTYKDSIFIIETDTFALIRTKKMDNWRTISGYPYAKNSTSNEKNLLYLYQVNDIEKKIRKIDILKDEVVFESSLEKFPAKGEILKVEKQALDVDYILTNEQGKYKIYLVNEKNLTLAKGKEGYADKTYFGKI